MLRFLFMLALLAVAIYFLVRVVQARGLLSEGSPPPRRPTRPRRPQKPRIVAPDDDEDFLRDLDRKRKRHKSDEGPPAA